MNTKRFLRILISAVLLFSALSVLLLATGCNDPDEGDDESVTTELPVSDSVTDEPVVEPVDFTVSNVFGSNMVIQRNEYIRVWGWADEKANGKTIRGEFAGVTASTTVEDGAWELVFETCLPASKAPGNSMRIFSDGKEVVFEDVLVGDVYMVIGQSNVAYSVAEHQANVSADRGGPNMLDYNAPIRLFYNSLNQTTGYPQRGTEEVCPEVVSDSRWEKASRTKIQRFSAIGYFFAYHYQELTGGDIPVGLIEIDGNGLPIGTFMSNQVATQLGTDTYDAASGTYITVGVNAGAGRYMYNHYMYPFERYPIAGVLWYQGESDCLPEHAIDYPEKFAALMTYMRSTHNLVNPDFPVYYVEFPSIYLQPEDFTPSDAAPFWAYLETGIIRASMGRIPRVLENCYPIVSSDLWNDRTFWNNLHPNCKFEQAERMARIVTAVKGEGGSLPESVGPVLLSAQFSEDGKSVVLTYDYVGEGLTTSDGGTSVRGFWAVDDYLIPNGVSILSAEITAKDQVTVTCDDVITALVYHNVGPNYFGDEINLCNSYGIPAAATVAIP